MTTTYIILNLLLAAVAVAAIYGLVIFAHKLPDSAPESDSTWGTGGDPWIPSEPLPLREVAQYADERETAARAA